MGEKAGSVFNQRVLYFRARNTFKEVVIESLNIIDREILNAEDFNLPYDIVLYIQEHIAVAGFEFAESVFGEEFQKGML